MAISVLGVLRRRRCTPGTWTSSFMSGCNQRVRACAATRAPLSLRPHRAWSHGRRANSPRSPQNAGSHRTMITWSRAASPLGVKITTEARSARGVRNGEGVFGCPARRHGPFPDHPVCVAGGDTTREKPHRQTPDLRLPGRTGVISSCKWGNSDSHSVSGLEPLD